MFLSYPLRSLICNEEPDMNVNDIIKKILYMLKQCNDVWVFKNIDLSLTLISVNDERMNDVGKQIEEFILELGGFSKRVMLVLADQSGSFENMEDIFRFKDIIIPDHYLCRMLCHFLRQCTIGKSLATGINSINHYWCQQDI